MPVIGCGDDNGVDVLVFEKFADIGIGGDGFVALPEVLHFRAEIGLVHIAEGNDAHAWDLAEIPDLVPAHASDFHPGADTDHQRLLAYAIHQERELHFRLSSLRQ